MATNPYFTQYHTQRFSFVGNPQQRDGLTSNDVKDQRFLNVYPELIRSPISDGKKYYLKKRPGTGIVLSQVGATGVPRGVYFWNNAYYSVVGNQLFYGTAALGTLNTSSGPVGFTEFQFANGAVDLFLSDGTNLYQIQPNNVVTLITAVNFGHVPAPVYLDGYIFLIVNNSAEIRNSTLNDPTTWPSDGFITAEMFPDNAVMLSKVQNYLAVIGQYSVEWFYDNANPTGSPLQRNAPAVTQFGSPAPYSVNQTEKELIMVGSTKNGGRTVWLINGFQPTEIAIEPIREALDDEGDNMVNAFAFTIQSCGHKWYVLNLVGSLRTFVYDFDEQMWHEWATGTNNNFMANYATDTPHGYPVVQDTATGHLYKLSPDFYTDKDGSSNIVCQVVTVKIDFDTIKRKRLYRLSLICDAPNGNNTVTMNVEFSDDDYNTWGIARVLNMNATYPTLTQCGLFRRRAFRFTYTQPFPLRLESFELDIIQEVRR